MLTTMWLCWNWLTDRLWMSNFLIVFSVRPCSRFVLAFNDVVPIKFYDRNHCFGHMVALAGREESPNCGVSRKCRLLPGKCCQQHLWHAGEIFDFALLSACGSLVLNIYCVVGILMLVWTVDVHVYSFGRNWRWNKEWHCQGRKKRFLSISAEKPGGMAIKGNVY